MAVLAYTNIFTADIDRLADFYSSLFGLEEYRESRSPIFRGFAAGGTSLGFSGTGAYELLGMAPQTEPGDRVFQTFNVDSPEEVQRLTRQAARPLPPRAETQAPAPRRRQWTMPCAALRGRAGGRRRPHTSVTIC